LQLLAPLGALALLAVPAIVLLYFLKVRRPEVRVATLMFWRLHLADRQANAPWQRLRPSLLLLVLAFGLATRSRWAWAAASLGGAILLKQFAIVALPFFVILLLRRARRDQLAAPAVAFSGIVLAGFIPFLVADPGALWRDTVTYGAGTYRIIGYGLAALLLRAHALHSRTGYYPFVPLVAAVWLPITAWLLRLQWRLQAVWAGPAAFTVSMFLLLFLARVFQTSYLIWPLVGGALAMLLAGAEREQPEPQLSA
jgi:uncharacterized membrane protein